MSMLAKIATAINTTLINQFAKDLASQFELDQDEVSQFVKEWSKANVGTSRQAKVKKDPNVPTRTSGYLLFSADQRAKLNKKEAKLSKEKKTPQKDAMSQFGAAWRALSDTEKNKWNVKAAAQNTKNGIQTGKGTRKGKAKGKEKVTEKPNTLVREQDEEEVGGITAGKIREWFNPKGGKSVKELREMLIALEPELADHILKMSKALLRESFEAYIPPTEA